MYSILEDKAGNIWVGTKTGLCRYDPSVELKPGSKTFTHIPITGTYGYNSNNSFNNDLSTINGVWTMMQDKSGRIWFGTDDGVYCYDGENFSWFLDNIYMINKDHLHLESIFSIVEDKKGNIWMASCIGDQDLYSLIKKR